GLPGNFLPFLPGSVLPGRHAYFTLSQGIISPKRALWRVASRPMRKIFPAAQTQATVAPAVSAIASSTCHQGGAGCSASRSCMMKGDEVGNSDAATANGLDGDFCTACHANIAPIAISMTGVMRLWASFRPLHPDRTARQ